MDSMERKCSYCNKVSKITYNTDNSAASKSYSVHCSCECGGKQPGFGTVTSRGLPTVSGGWVEDEMPY